MVRIMVRILVRLAAGMIMSISLLNRLKARHRNRNQPESNVLCNYVYTVT
jgi:hypothetical protein